MEHIGKYDSSIKSGNQWENQTSKTLAGKGKSGFILDDMYR